MRDDDPVLTVLPGTGERVALTDPARALRAATSVRAVLEELREVDIDDSARDRLASILTGVQGEIAEVLASDLTAELEALDLPDPGTASMSELRLSLAQLLGWMEGLFHGVSADLVSTDRADEPGTGRTGHYL